MAVIDTFVGRENPVTKHPVTVQLMRLFDPKTLQDVWAVVFTSGNKHEEYNNLTHNEARVKWNNAKAWWS